ncbi:hypothetical protein MMC21_000886 [Puttea exsequens]|nr:hypothetical protein [Puttea exsequens]
MYLLWNNDIGLVGAPFDTAVTYRPGKKRSHLSQQDIETALIHHLCFLLGAQFGPRAIRAASSRQGSHGGYNTRAGINPYTSWVTIVDCGDIPITPLDNALALAQMSDAFLELGYRSLARTRSAGSTTSEEGSRNPRAPRLITLGGDHSIALPALRALNKLHGQPVAVLHFDSHLDPWRPTLYPEVWQTDTSAFTHGSRFWMASKEGLILNGSSVHAGLRTRLRSDGSEDHSDDDRQGFLRLSSDDIDEMGISGIIETILTRIGKDTPTYQSVDIDIIDSGLAPGTGTPEPGG